MSTQETFRYYLFYKPFGYVSRFTDEDGNPGLARILSIEKDVYPVGRLDKDSEGLLLLTNDKRVNQQLLRAENNHRKTYQVQVEGRVTQEALEQLCKGVTLRIKKNSYTTLPAQAKEISEPTPLPERNPPIRFRKNVPTSWIELQLIEGKNRQVRRMTAAVGFPTLRLIRSAVETINLNELQPGDCIALEEGEFYRKLNLNKHTTPPAKPHHKSSGRNRKWRN